jgi:L-rhamnose mutarotase
MEAIIKFGLDTGLNDYNILNVYKKLNINDALDILKSSDIEKEWHSLLTKYIKKYTNKNEKVADQISTLFIDDIFNEKRCA